MGTPNFNVGSSVWVEDTDLAWVDGVVQSVKENEAEIQTSNGNMVVANLSNIHQKDTDSPAAGVEDMTKLLYLHEPGILHNLATRYDLNEIYTYTGNILIALNPFKYISELYDKCVMERYKGTPTGEQGPHVYAIAEAAYRAMIDEAKSNSILVSGESGAGKTETTKMLMRYLAFMGGNTGSEGRTVEQKVLESNPVLEAFGNAKTVRNNNSSRFGKFVEIQFDKHGRISGAAIRTYLLERSRVCQISDAERNYHCFYLLCAAPREIIEKYKLGQPQSFHYLNQSSCYQLAGVNDAKDYIDTRKAMNIVGISENDQDAIFRVVAAILHLGNIDFDNEEDEVVASVIKDDTSRFHLQMTAELLMCDAQEIEDALCKRLMVTGRDKIKKSLDATGAAISRDGLAKTIYSRLFNWLVDKINESIGQDSKSTGLIGVLDIYGFESFDSNSFEQFCINFTNEKLQQHFNQHVLKMDQEEYTKEDISWSYIKFIDNQDVLDLIEKKPGGIISLLDEACMFPKATHETFSEKLYQTFTNHKRFIKPKLARSDFTIVHYAGEVQYQSDQFLDKNKDYVVPEHQNLLSASKCSFVVDLFPPAPEEAPKSSKFSSIGSRFKIQLQQLMDTLNSTKPHYIRCVKPNNRLKPAIFDNVTVLRQLRSGGVLEAIKIKCGGFPAQMPFDEFLSRFLVLAPEVLNGNYEMNVACKWILEKLEIEGYQIGKTKVFLRSGNMADLDAHKARVLHGSAQVIQRQMKTHFSRKRFLSLQKASVSVQTYWRGEQTSTPTWSKSRANFARRCATLFAVLRTKTKDTSDKLVKRASKSKTTKPSWTMARKVYKEMKIGKRERAIICIQKDYRRLMARRSYLDVKFSALILQTSARTICARHQLIYRKKSRAGTTIQRYWRGYIAFSHYQKLKKAALLTQCSWKKKKGLPVSKSLERTNGHRIHLQDNQIVETNPLPVNKETSKGEAEGHGTKSRGNRVGEPIALPGDRSIRMIEEPGVPLQGDDNIKALTAEVQHLKALLQEQKQRADDLERKYAEAHVSMKRMVNSMSDQFSELKNILHTLPSSSGLTSDDQDGSEHSNSKKESYRKKGSKSKKEGAFDVF